MKQRAVLRGGNELKQFWWLWTEERSGPPDSRAPRCHHPPATWLLNGEM